jgi:hypothetical protein
MIVGAHVGETSVLTRAGITLAHAIKDRLVGHEGAFGTHLLTRDVFSDPLMFGRRGFLKACTINEHPTSTGIYPDQHKPFMRLL